MPATVSRKSRSSSVISNRGGVSRVMVNSRLWQFPIGTLLNASRMPRAAPRAGLPPQGIGRAVLLSNVGKRGKSNVWKGARGAAKLNIGQNEGVGSLFRDRVSEDG